MNSFNNTPASTLIEESNEARKLVELLKKEQAQLIAADIEGLTASTEEKAVVVARMTELATSRHNTLAAAGFAAKESGMQDWLKASASTDASQTWNEFLSLAKSAKELNRINGLLISKHMIRNQQALNTLQSGGQSQTFYGPNGQSSTKTTVRGLAIG